MAYADTIRTATADLNDVAGLIDGSLVAFGSYAGSNIAQTTLSPTYVALGAASIALTVPSSSKVMIYSTASISNNTPGAIIYTGVSEDSTIAVGGAPSLMVETVASTSGYRLTQPNFHIFSPAAGTHTYRILWCTSAGTAYCWGASIYGAVFRQ